MTTARLLATLVLALLPGCAFNREVVNPQYRNLDTSGLKVGVSSWMDVLAKLGPPTPPNSESIGQEGASLRFFRYPCTEVRTTGFTFPIGLVLPFTWVDDQLVEDTVIEFDDNGLVAAIHHGGQGGIWRPWDDEDDRPPRFATTTDGARR